MIGDRETDLAFARNLGIRSARVRVHGSDAEQWPAVTHALLARRAHLGRQTRETSIDVEVELDASGESRIATGIGFFDHMLEQLAKHGGFRLQLRADGDLHIDEHHTVEDCALALGETLRRALGDKAGIGRYGFLLPMDESEAQVAIDLAGRAVFPVRRPLRPRADRHAADRAGAAFLPLARRRARVRAAPGGARREHPPHDRGLLQGSGPGAAAGVAPGRTGPAEHQGHAVSPRTDVAIIDSGGANLASLAFALERLGARSIVSSDAAVIARAPRVLLPGVGAAGNAMQRLRAQRLDTLIPRLTAPLLGICLGMQLLFAHSAEGDTPCLGVLDGTVERLHSQPGRPVPHMGWNTLQTAASGPAARRTRGRRSRLLRTQLCGAPRAFHARRDRLRRPAQRGRAPRELLRRAVPSGALERGRGADPAQFPGPGGLAAGPRCCSSPPSTCAAAIACVCCAAISRPKPATRSTRPRCSPAIGRSARAGCTSSTWMARVTVRRATAG